MPRCGEGLPAVVTPSRVLEPWDALERSGRDSRMRRRSLTQALPRRLSYAMSWRGRRGLRKKSGLGEPK